MDHRFRDLVRADLYRLGGHLWRHAEAIMNLIRLSVRNGQWIARYDGPHALKIVWAFGSPDVPTAYTSAASPGEVAEEIGKRNPGCTIQVG